MKIIEPLRLDGEGVVSSNAPDDVAIPWEPVGVDLYQGRSKIMTTAVGNKVYAIDYTSNAVQDPIKVYNTDTQVTEPLELDGMGGVLSSVLVSPNGNYLALVEASFAGWSTRYSMNIYSLATGLKVYSRSRTANSGRVSDSDVRRGMAWSPDSTKFAFWAFKEDLGYIENGGARSHVYVVNTSTWTAVESQQTPFNFRSDVSIKPAANDSYRDLCWSADGGFVYVSGTSSQTYLGNEHFMLKIAAGTGAVSAVVSDGNESLLVFNELRSEIIATTGAECRVYSASSMAVQSDRPLFSAISRYATDPIIVLNSGKLYVRARSGVELHTTFDLSDYSNDGPLNPATPIDLGSESADHYVTRTVSNGFGLLSKANFSAVESANPLVYPGSIYTRNQRLYEVLLPNSDRPEDGVVLEPPTWLDLGAINRLRMIDETIGTYTEAPDYLEILVAPSELVDGIGLFNLTAASYQIELLDDAGEPVFSTGEISLIDVSGVHGWYSYFNDEPAWQTDAVQTALPPYRGATIRITVQGLGGTARVGELVAGRVRDLGDLEFGADTGILDFSRKDRDEFGVVRLIEGQYSNRVRYPVSIRSARILGVRQILTRLRGRKFVFIGDESAPETFLYGFYRSFSLVRKGPIYSECSIQAESLAQ